MVFGGSEGVSPVVRLMPKLMGKDCNEATRITQHTTWLESAPKTHRVLKNTAPTQDEYEKAKQIQQTTWLESVPKTQRVLKKTAPAQDDYEKEKQIEFEEQRAIWSREGVFWSKRTETFEVRREGYPSTAVSGHWFFNKINGKLEMYGDIRQPPVETKEAVFFETHKK